MRFKYLLTTFILVFSLGFFYSCSDSNSEETSDFPDDVTEFSTPEQAAEFATSSMEGAGEFIGGALSYLRKPAGDTTYYKDGWWWNVGDYYYGDDTTGWQWTYTNKYRFKKNGVVQQDTAGVDEMDVVMDIVASFTGYEQGTSYEFSLKYSFDLNYTNLRSPAPVVNGSGYYDYKIKYVGTKGNQNIRYYVKYTFDELAIPYEGYPTGKLTVESKKYKVVMVFNGTNIIKVSVYEDGTLVWGPNDYDLDSDYSNYLPKH